MDFSIKSLFSRIRAAVKGKSAQIKSIQPALPKNTNASTEFQIQPIYKLNNATRYPFASGAATTRTQMARDAWNMYLEDDRVRAGLNMAAQLASMDGAGGQPFSIEFANETGSGVSQKEGDLLRIMEQPDVDYFNRVERIIKAAWHEGTVYYRKIVDLEKNEIVGYRKIKGPLNGFRVDGPLESENQELNGVYVQIDLSTGHPVNVFFPWEIDVYSWEHDDEMGYGLPLMSSSRRNYAKLKELEDTLPLYRKSRTAKQLIYKLQSTTADQAREEIAAIESQQSNMGDDRLYKNIYATNDVKADHPIFNADPLHDVRYKQDKLFDALRVPRGMYGAGGEKVNRATLEFQINFFIDTTIAATQAMINAGHNSFVETHLNLQGDVTAGSGFRRVWPEKKVLAEKIIELFGHSRDQGVISNNTFVTRLFGLDYDHEQENLASEPAAAASEPAQEPVEPNPLRVAQ